jgi:L-seryl-tRNA(Ser) seleniumtransferase
MPSGLSYAARVDPRRQVPSVDKVLAALDDNLPHGVRVTLARQAVEAARESLARGREFTDDTVVADARARAERFRGQLLRPVINATGVLLHTNLGRAPLGPDALDAIGEAAGYTNVEYRVDEGIRGSRHEHAGSLLALACGAEAGIVVNNNAAAVLLVLATLARGRSVLVSRGELVEIGGGFRVPEIMAETGARLVEVGTTNRTRCDDYARAIDNDTALVLKVHASNYRMVGFVESTAIADLVTLGPPVVVDAGSGLLDETTPWLPARPKWMRDELGVKQCLEAGAALVTFSGDKLLGGPQAGVVVGRRALIDRLKAHPLARAVRADKLTLAAMQSVALAYLARDVTDIPFWRMATAPLDGLRARAERIAASVPGAKVIETEAVAGGGSLPGLGIPSCGVAAEIPPDAGPIEMVAAALRRNGVVARVEHDQIVCDVRTVDPADDEGVARALARVRALHDGGR